MIQATYSVKINIVFTDEETFLDVIVNPILQPKEVFQCDNNSLVGHTMCSQYQVLSVQ